ncbi:MAG: glycosyltransferase family 1 protein [Rhizobiales bacterium]|nr:glycosyltransferase family 1 protein [Hyphomicrobiales bacterium]
MRILIATDAWRPQVNGVVRTLERTSLALKERGHEVHFLSGGDRRTWPLPFYPEIRLTFLSPDEAGAQIVGARPDAIYIATEGPIGWATRRWCLRNKIPFTTGFHTKLADYTALRIPFPGVEQASWSFLRQFHKPSRCVLTPTPSIAKELTGRGFPNTRSWTRGVDHELFKPGPRDHFDLPRPVMLVAGRVAPEKNLEAFLKLDLPGTKVVVGDGPSLELLKRRYPAAVFTGYAFDHDLVRMLQSADVFVFPSRTDTFGLVMIEAMACGTPVAAFAVPSPVDVVAEGLSGAVDADLGKAINRALTLDRGNVHAYARNFTWAATADLFERHLMKINWSAISPPLPRTSPSPFPLR